ncbi:MAG: nitrate reductase molybdenum cofactor assembly chaperone [Candidatus Omnitrophica bacterium]|nr:nitrate reductase molybdenum cofactor assembly chaperone [Candidatus Omnitrophota bacterium]
METQIFKSQFYSQLGSCLEYPATAQAWEMLSMTASEIQSSSEQASNFLREFISKMKRMDLGMKQEYFVKTFDLMPECSLYLSVHLFGEESFRRAELMAGLKATYERNGAWASTELPDHLAVVLKQSVALSPEEWADLVSMAIIPALPIMIDKLEKNKNPYALVLKAVQVYLVEMEKPHV